MKIKDPLYVECFETKITQENEFEISITEESDLTLDGGYSYEIVTNSKPLTRIEAISLYKELSVFISDK